MPTIQMMTAQAFNALRGYHNNPHALIYQLNINTSIDFPAGAVLSRNGTPLAVLGVGNAKVQAFFAWQPSSWIQGLYGSQANPTVSFSAPVIMQHLKVQGLVASAPYELVTSHYDTSLTYNLDAPLTSPRTGANTGKLIPGTHGTHTIVGIVSQGVVESYARPGLAFWSCLMWPA